MSQTTAGPGNQLSEVINRINALTQKSHLAQMPVEDDIPRLTEAYGGSFPLPFIDATSTTLPTLEDRVHEVRGEMVADRESLTGDSFEHNEVQGQPFTADQQQRLLDEMEPMIKAAVKKAILGELVVIEKALKTTIEQDIMDALKKRIQSGQF